MEEQEHVSPTEENPIQPESNLKEQEYDWNRWHDLIDLEARGPLTAEQAAEFVVFKREVARLDKLEVERMKDWNSQVRETLSNTEELVSIVEEVYLPEDVDITQPTVELLTSGFDNAGFFEDVPLSSLKKYCFLSQLVQ